MRSITAVFTAFIASALVITAHAETYDSISVSDTPSAGDNFTVTVSISSDSDIGYLQSTLEYDERDYKEYDCNTRADVECFSLS